MILTQGCGGQVAAPTTGHTGSSCPRNPDTDTEAGSTRVRLLGCWGESINILLYVDGLRMLKSIRALVEWIFTAGISFPLRIVNIFLSFDFDLLLSIFKFLLFGFSFLTFFTRLVFKPLVRQSSLKPQIKMRIIYLIWSLLSTLLKLPQTLFSQAIRF